jgi:hypothetical protein
MLFDSAVPFRFLDFPAMARVAWRCEGFAMQGFSFSLIQVIQTVADFLK